MKILKLILHNYKRVFLNDITHIEYTPESLMQIILGQNGSGKSSLLEQLTPLSPNLKKDFKEEGYKSIHIEHDSRVYNLVNKHPSSHSFILDGEELNNSGTVTVQNKLVEDHFGITTHIQQILLGKNNFTNMTPSERKKWITDMSSIDYSYAITVYNKLKQRHRDIVGGIKLLQNNIVRAKQSALPVETLNILKTDKCGLEHLVDHLFTLLTSHTQEPNLDASIDNVTKIVNKVRNHTVTTNCTLDELKNSYTANQTKRDMLSEHLAKHYKDLDNLAQIDVTEDKCELTRSLSETESEIKLLLNNNRFSSIVDIELVHDYLTTNYGDIISNIAPLSEYTTLDISKEHILVLQSKLRASENETKAMSVRLVKLEEKLAHIVAHLEKDSEVECPRCNHLWTPDYNQKEHTNCESVVNTLTKLIGKADRNIIRVTKELDKIEYVRSIVTNFIRYFNINDDTRRLLEYVKETGGKDIHTKLFSIFEYVVSEIRLLYPIVSLKTKRDMLIIKLDKLKDRELIKLDINASNKEKILLSIDRIRVEQKSIDIIIDELRVYIRQRERHLELLKDLTNELKTLYMVKTTKLEVIRNKAIKKSISELRSELMDIDNKLTRNTEYETMVTTYQNELNGLNHKEKLLNITLKELSPSEGLIAKSISSFLNYFIQDMNNIISSIWGYDMEILSCDLEDNDLDYKFKVLVNNDEVIEDISKTSSSMQEMINLVFKIIFSKYKGFMGNPLILDEFGRTFDSNHRITAYEALERTISNNFSQVYMVSHFESMYGRFGNADVSILGTTGVDINTIDKYNNVMKIT